MKTTELKLEEAVASGRRWRYVGPGGLQSPWFGPGHDSIQWPTEIVLSSDFEIEPEPEKLREWFLCFHTFSIHQVPATPTENPQFGSLCNCGESPSGNHARVHDAAACDKRLAVLVEAARSYLKRGKPYDAVLFEVLQSFGEKS